MELNAICKQTRTNFREKIQKTLKTMDSEMANVSQLPLNKLIDPNSFDVTMSAVLIGLGAEKYIDIFR